MKNTQRNDKDEQVSTFLKRVCHVACVHALDRSEEPRWRAAMTKREKYRFVREARKGCNYVQKEQHKAATRQRGRVLRTLPWSIAVLTCLGPLHFSRGRDPAQNPLCGVNRNIQEGMQGTRKCSAYCFIGSILK